MGGYTMDKLYSLSNDLIENVLAMARLVEEKLGGIVKFEEYIVLPDYGEKIVIRFKLTNDIYMSIEELDEIENSIRNILGVDYWANLLGDNYEKFGFNRHRLSDSLKNIDLNILDNVINYKSTSYCQYIKRDKETIRKLLSLTSQQKIWEIQSLSDKDIYGLILIIDESIKSEGEFENLFEKDLNIDDQIIKIIYCKNHKSFNGIIKAYIMAEKNKISLNHMIMKYQQS
jgi:hypothetical protein